jgi:LPS-assembly protein
VPRSVRHPLACALALALAAPTTLADTVAAGPVWALCRAPEALPGLRPSPAVPASAAVRAASPVLIEAGRLDVSAEGETVFRDRVELFRADQWLATGELRYQHEAGTWQSPGPLRFEDARLRFEAASARANEATERIELDDVRYQLIDERAGSGVARQARREGERSHLVGATFSTCPPGQRQWEFEAATLDIDDATETGVARNATLRLGGVPVLWLPWAAFPTTEARRSGFLAPTLGYSGDRGVDLELPYYLNLAPNYDATLSPRWMSRRGLMLGAEFRYLGERDRGEFRGTFLPDDDLTGRDRGMASWQHHSVFSPQWSASADLQHVSDADYLRDFGADFGQHVQLLLPSSAVLAGRGRGWSTWLSAERWQIAHPVLPPGSEPFSRLPRFRGRLAPELGGWIEPSLDAELVRFHHEERAGGQRLDLLPRLRLPLGGAAWFATPSLGWRHTAWTLEQDPTLPGRDRRPQRSLPIASLDAGMVFERAAGGGRWLQTLEPRLFYLRVPHREQDGLPLFDTQPLSFGWPGLFRENRFSGADRQADAHHVTLAVTSRLLGAEDGREQLAASLGRIVHLDPPRLRLPGEPAADPDGSAYVAELDWQINDAWSLRSTQQWDPGRRATQLSALRAQYRFGERGVFNASYRYREGLLEQTDLSFAAPLSAEWRAVGRWAWSLREDRNLEALAGLEWRSCCMAVRVLAREHLRDFDGRSNRGVYLEVELNGIGRFGRDSERLLSDAILGFSP